jgi:hypothetical protein
MLHQNLTRWNSMQIFCSWAVNFALCLFVFVVVIGFLWCDKSFAVYVQVNFKVLTCLTRV